MRGKILQLTDLQDSVYERADFDQFVDWYQRQVKVQLDIETNVVERWNEYKLITIQFGSCTSQRVHYVFQWSYLTDAQRATIKQLLQDDSVEKLAHNAKFEYIVLRFHDIIIDHIYDTMLAEKVLRGGLENIEYALADISYKYLRIIMNKEEQANFGDNIMTDSKIEYAATDVMYLDIIQRTQIMEAKQKELLNVFSLEMEALPGFSDMTYNGMGMDTEKWRENIRLAEPIVIESEKTLNAWLFKEPFHQYALLKGYLSDRDRCIVNFGSPQKRTELIQLLFPSLIGGTKPIVKKYIRDNGKTMAFDDMELLHEYMEQDYLLMEERLVINHRDYLISQGYLIPANQVTINWNSQQQVLPLIQLVIPRLTSLAEEERNKFFHQILIDWADYGEANKLITTYGEKFLREKVDSDGKVRTNFNQVVSTGRVSSSKPNMQNIPVKEKVGTRYRNAFIPDPGWLFVDSDYTGQELALIAFASKDPVWNKAIRERKDLHSICAELVFGRKWKEAAEPTCQYYFAHIDKDGVYYPAESKLKCSCKKHKILRDAIKAINFGLAYGMSEIKLAGTLKISRQEALNMIADYFKVFPGIKRTLDFLGEFGVRNGYIQTFSPFFRKRWFPFWYEHRGYIEAHVSGIKYHPTLGEIERASKNMPFQGGGGDMVKMAVILIRNYTKEHNLWNKIKLNMQVHDQITCSAIADYASEWKDIMDRLMCKAADIIVTTGILKADTNISSCWTK